MDLLRFSVLLLAVADAARFQPNLPTMPEKYDNTDIERVACTNDHENERTRIMDQASCGPPKDVFEPLRPKSKTLEVIPSAVWVKRCVGTCDHSAGSSCIPTETAIRQVPVRMFDESTGKESCALFPVEEHVACRCCSAPAQCAPPRQFNARKCACVCPEPEHRIRCLRQHNMRWNRHKCQCEEKKNGYPRRFKPEPLDVNRPSRRARLILT